LCSGTTLYAQKEANIWYFGDKAGIDFTQTPPKALVNSQMHTNEGCITICDSSGSLLFYSDGKTVWNENHVVLDGGEQLLGHFSSTHSAYVLKMPQSNLYYLFTSDAAKTPGIHNNWGVRYTVIDMSQNSGAGKVIEKNKLLVNKSSERITSTKHQNNRDYWLVIPQMYTDTIFIFKFTEKGIEYPPIKYNSGSKSLRSGQIKFSPDCKKLAFAGVENNATVVFDFDNLTGEITNKRELIDSSGYMYSIEFSPNSKFLYVGIAAHIKKLYQCELDILPQSSYINNVGVDLTASQPNKKVQGNLQLAIDNKIYLSTWGDSGLAVIEFPNKKGVSCNLIYNGIDLKGRLNRHGLPSFDKSYIVQQPQSISTKKHCIGDSTEIFFSFSVSDSMFWLLGDGKQIITSKTTLKHKYSDTGSYLITAITYRQGTISDTITHRTKIYSLPKLNLGNDTLLCMGDSLTFNLQHPSIENYLWSTGDIVATKTINTTGAYAVEISNYGCRASDTINIKQLTNCQLTAVNFCYGDDTELSITNTNADSITWDFGDGIFQTTTNDSIAYKYQDSGTFTVIAKQYLEGLITNIIKQITITRVDKPNLGNDTIICIEKNLQINYPPLFDNYIWNDGTNTPVKAITNEGLYWMEVEKNGCKGRDSIEVLFYDCDFTISNKCLGDTTEIKLAGNNQDSVKWELGDNTSQTTFSSQTKHKYIAKGSYITSAKVYIGKHNISVSKSFEIIEFPKSGLPKDTGICENQTINASINSPNASILWSNGSNLPLITPKQSGQFILTLTEGECITKDTINIAILECGCDLYFPNAYSPNNNNLNELFYPTTECPLKQYKLQIFNRWGAVIFESQDIKQGWDGTYKSLPVPNGTYIWVATYQSLITGKKHNQKGSITLLR
jgi:gliding motility-associated-like protein